MRGSLRPDWATCDAFPAREEYSDEELDAEVQLIGSLMLEPQLAAMPLVGLGLYSFCEPFHAAVYHAILFLIAMGRKPDPLNVWWMVGDHPDAECFGFQQIVDMATDAATPERIAEDQSVLIARQCRRGVAFIATNYGYSPLPPSAAH